MTKAICELIYTAEFQKKEKSTSLKYFSCKSINVLCKNLHVILNSFILWDLVLVKQQAN